MKRRDASATPIGGQVAARLDPRRLVDTLRRLWGKERKSPGGNERRGGRLVQEKKRSARTDRLVELLSAGRPGKSLTSIPEGLQVTGGVVFKMERMDSRPKLYSTNSFLKDWCKTPSSKGRRSPSRGGGVSRLQAVHGGYCWDGTPDPLR